MTTTLLRVASVLSLLFAAGHTLGGRKSWSPWGETEVLRAMRTSRFEGFGVSRTYLECYLGFGLTISVFLVLQAVVLWQLAGLAKTGLAAVRPLIVSFALASVACGILAWRFILPIPAVFGAVVALFLGWAAVAAR